MRARVAPQWASTTTIFFASPVLITSWLGRVIGNDYLEVAIEGVLRLAMFIGYIRAAAQRSCYKPDATRRRYGPRVPKSPTP